ncbi:hypothetical protein [Aeromicrobium piscarium]|uniref:Uncharacterized protein n=1 Tax=Aeromicrobium piscarium TaxID=2590901 RepID=A0A554SP25_9ACTN|nr:hypothetical protein [Aeromicrobium piscarium]TSD68106.1 hypothetical protein FNM00_00480 [Aeromicrobium piscarium]
MNTHRPPCINGEHCGEAAHCPPQTNPAEEIFLKQAGISDVAEFKAAGIQCAMSGLTAADLTRIAAAHARGDLVIPDDPEAAPDLSLIPSSREEARPVEVNGVVVTCYQKGGWLWLLLGGGIHVYRHVWADSVTSVRPVTILADDQVAVSRELIERAKAWTEGTSWSDRGPIYEILRYLAAVDRGEDHG